MYIHRCICIFIHIYVHALRRLTNCVIYTFDFIVKSRRLPISNSILHSLLASHFSSLVALPSSSSPLWLLLILLPCQCENICLNPLDCMHVLTLTAGQPLVLVLVLVPASILRSPLSVRYPISPMPSSLPPFALSSRRFVDFCPGRFDVDYAKPIMKWLWGLIGKTLRATNAHTTSYSHAHHLYRPRPTPLHGVCLR